MHHLASVHLKASHWFGIHVKELLVCLKVEIQIPKLSPEPSSSNMSHHFGPSGSELVITVKYGHFRIDRDGCQHLGVEQVDAGEGQVGTRSTCETQNTAIFCHPDGIEVWLINQH